MALLVAKFAVEGVPLGDEAGVAYREPDLVVAVAFVVALLEVSHLSRDDLRQARIRHREGVAKAFDVSLDGVARSLVGDLADAGAVALDVAVTGARVAVMHHLHVDGELLVALTDLAVADVASHGLLFGRVEPDRVVPLLGGVHGVTVFAMSDFRTVSPVGVRRTFFDASMQVPGRRASEANLTRPRLRQTWRQVPSHGCSMKTMRPAASARRRKAWVRKERRRDLLMENSMGPLGRFVNPSQSSCSQVFDHPWFSRGIVNG